MEYNDDTAEKISGIAGTAFLVSIVTGAILLIFAGVYILLNGAIIEVKEMKLIYERYEAQQTIKE